MATWHLPPDAQNTIAHAGYGKQDPVTVLDCWRTILSMLLGVCIWTFLGGIVTTLLIHLNAASSEYTAKITALNQYMAHRKLPQVLKSSTMHKLGASSQLVQCRPSPSSTQYALPEGPCAISSAERH